MAIKNSVSNDFLSAFINSINVFDGVMIHTQASHSIVQIGHYHFAYWVKEI